MGFGVGLGYGWERDAGNDTVGSTAPMGERTHERGGSESVAEAAREAGEVFGE